MVLSCALGDSVVEPSELEPLELLFARKDLIAAEPTISPPGPALTGTETKPISRHIVCINSIEMGH